MTPERGKRPIVVVLGMHRCGTSLLARLLVGLGVRLGRDLLPADEWNEAGYWEHREIFDAQDAILGRLGRTWYRPEGVLPLPDGWLGRPSVRTLRDRLAQVVADEVRSADGLWGFKDPRTAWLLPMWHEIFDELNLEPIYLLALRDPRAVSGSLAARNKLSPRLAESVWLRTYFDALRYTGGRIGAILDYDRWFGDPGPQIGALLSALGLPDDGAGREAVREALVPSLRHHGPRPAGAVARASEERRFAVELAGRVYALLRDASPAGRPSPELARLESAYRLTAEAFTLGCDEPALATSPVAKSSEPVALSAPAFRIEPLPAGEAGSARSTQRICIVSTEFIGPYRNGGIGTASTTLGEVLAEAGHEVTLLYARDTCENGTIEDWIGRYAEKGIRFVPLPAEAEPRTSGPAAALRPYRVFLWLREHDAFDVIHFHEMTGIGYFALLAKREGLAFSGATLCVGTHSPHAWLREANAEYLREPLDLELDFVEQRSVELADVVWSPSRYMLEWLRDHGWPLPATCYVRPNILPRAARLTASFGDDRTLPVREIVFFGRLETRKGLSLFCDALDALADGPPQALTVTFLGRHASVHGRPSAQYLEERGRKWGFAWQVLCDLDQPEAIRYLRGEGRVAVIASPIDNSPCTVAECLGARVPLLACHTGGIPELIADEDVARVCFPYQAQALAERLREVLSAGLRPARPRLDFTENELAWERWHASLPSRGSAQPARMRPTVDPLVTICIPHHDRPDYLEQALESVRAQDYRDIEVVLVDDGSTDPAALAYLERLEPEFRDRGWKIVRQENRYLGAARNTAARHAHGEYLLFLDDDNYAKPHAVRRFVEVARATDADVVTCFMDFFRGQARPDTARTAGERWIFLGGAALPGIYRNVFGDAFALVRRCAFLAAGGFTEDYGVTHEDWEFFAEAALAGLRFEVVPEALFWYRVGENSMIRTTDVYRNHMRHIRPFKKRMPPQLVDLVPFSQAQQLWRGQLLNVISGYHLFLQQTLKAWIDCGHKLAVAGRPDEAGAVLTEALALAERTGHAEVMIEALISAGTVAIRLEAVDEARRHFEDALARAREARYDAGVTRVTALLAQVARLEALAV